MRAGVLALVVTLAMPTFAAGAQHQSSRASAPEPAQDAASVPPAPQPASDKPLIEAFDDWEVRCYPIESVSPCDMLFTEIRKSNKQRITSVSIAYVPARHEYVMQVAVPFGVALQDGLVISAAGGYKTGKMAFRRCDATGCYVETLVGDDFFNALKAGGEGAIGVVADGGQPVSFVLPLKGFAGAQAALVTLATQKATAPHTAAVR
jgi:invasion protein IalB